MANIPGEIVWQANDNAWFTTNAAEVFEQGITIYHVDGRYKFTDGATALSALPFMGGGSPSTTQNLQEVTDEGNSTTNDLVTTAAVKVDIGGYDAAKMDSNGINVLDSGLNTPLLEVDRITDSIKKLGVEIATVNDIPDISGLATLASPTFTGTVNLSGNTASSILETDASKNVISSTKKTAYNKNFGVTRGTVLQGSWRSTSVGSTSSGSSNTYSDSVLILGGEFSTGTMFEVEMSAKKTGSSGTYSLRVYVNDTPDLTGSPSLIATQSTTIISNTYTHLTRTFKVVSSTDTEGVAGGSNQATDFIQSTYTNSNIDWSTDKYIIAAVQCGNASDSATSTYIIVNVK